jgi:hypothetical protein
MATHWDQSNYLPNQKQGATHKKKFLTSKYQLLTFFPTAPVKLKLELQVGGRLVIATHWDQSNYLPNQKHGATHKYDLSVVITPLPGILHGCVLCSRVLSICGDAISPRLQ